MSEGIREPVPEPLCLAAGSVRVGPSTISRGRDLRRRQPGKPFAPYGRTNHELLDTGATHEGWSIGLHGNVRGLLSHFMSLTS